MAEPTQHPTPATPPDVRLLRSITLRNILSFGPDTPPLELRALNVLIGPNGSGKSNLLACLSLLPAMAGDLTVPFRTGGSNVKDWLNEKHPPAKLEIISVQPANALLLHQITFKADDYRVRIKWEIIKWLNTDLTEIGIAYMADLNGLRNLLLIDDEPRDAATISVNSSVLAQLRDSTKYRALAQLVHTYEGLAFFRDWSFGSISPIRQPQRADSPGNFLRDGGENLALVLNQLRRSPEIKHQIESLLNELYEGINGYETFVQAGYVELFLTEGKRQIPASRLSDGTLRYLCLLAILLHPTPPPLICLEEPELGLHPDAVVAVGKLIKEASTRTQLIITTHSQILLDTLSESPEDVVVCSKRDGATHMQRLDAEQLAVWLKDYSLGTLWNSGQLGGNRW